MGTTSDFNTAARKPNRHALGMEALELVKRPRDGASGNFGMDEQMEALLAKGAPVDFSEPETGRTLLMWACINCRAKVIHVLMRRGADIMRQDKAGMTALDHARKHRQKPAIAILEQAAEERRQKILQEARDVTTKRDTKILRPVVFKNRGGGNDRAGGK